MQKTLSLRFPKIVRLGLCAAILASSTPSQAGLITDWQKKKLGQKLADKTISIPKVMNRLAQRVYSYHSLPYGFFDYEETVEKPAIFDSFASDKIKPFIWLSWQGDDEGALRVLKKLASKSGVSPDTQTSSGYTSLMYAAYAGNLSAVRIILASGSSPDLALADHAGKTALMYAAASPVSPWPLVLLLKNSASPNQRDHQGRTALMHALLDSNAALRAEKIKILLSYGVDTTTPDNDGLTPHDYALWNHEEHFFPLPRREAQANAPQQQAARQEEAPNAPEALALASQQGESAQQGSFWERMPRALGRLFVQKAGEEAGQGGQQRQEAAAAPKPAYRLYDCGRNEQPGSSSLPPIYFANKDLLLELIKTSTHENVQAVLKLYRPNLRSEEWSELNKATQKRGWGKLKVVVNEGHLTLSHNPVDFLTHYRTPVDMNLTQVALKLYDQVNWGTQLADRLRPGLLSVADREEDNQRFTPDDLRTYYLSFLQHNPPHNVEREAKRLAMVVCRLHNLGDLNYRQNMNAEEQQRIDEIALTRNMLVAELARAGRHCFSRHNDTLTHALQVLLANEEAEAVLAKDFRYQLVSSLMSKRRDLIEIHLNKASSNERSHGRAYWLQFIGHDVGLPEFPPMPDFNYVYVVGRNAGWSKSEALAKFHKHYTPELMVEHLRSSVGIAGQAVGPGGAVGSAYASIQDKEYNIEFSRFYEWLGTTSLAPEAVMDDSLTGLSASGAESALFEVGDMLTMELP